MEEVRPLRAKLRALLETLDESAPKPSEKALADEVERLRMQVAGGFSSSTSGPPDSRRQSETVEDQLPKGVRANIRSLQPW